MAQALINLKTTTNARNNSISLTSKYEIFNSTAEITSKKATKSNKNGKKWEQVKMEKSQRTWAAWNIKRHKRVPNCTVTNRLNCKRICHAQKTFILLFNFFVILIYIYFFFFIIMGPGLLWEHLSVWEDKHPYCVKLLHCSCRDFSLATIN